MDPESVKIIDYCEARPLMRVGDMIGCRGVRPAQQVIIAVKGGTYDLSHVSTLVRDIKTEGTGRIEITEAVGGGMRYNYLSKVYEASHGELFWMPMDNTRQQQREIMELAARYIETPTKYDFWSTITAPFQGLGFVLDIKKFNCSESWWYFQTAVGRLLPRYNEKGKPIAPVPGDCPVWAGRRLYKLINVQNGGCSCQP